MSTSEQQPEVMDSSTLRERLEAIVSRISRIPSEEFEDDVLIREELGIDSLMAMEITAAVEREFRIEINETEMFTIQSVGAFAEFVERRYRETHG